MSSAEQTNHPLQHDEHRPSIFGVASTSFQIPVIKEEPQPYLKRRLSEYTYDEGIVDLTADTSDTSED